VCDEKKTKPEKVKHMKKRLTDINMSSVAFNLAIDDNEGAQIGIHGGGRANTPTGFAFNNTCARQNKTTG